MGIPFHEAYAVDGLGNFARPGQINSGIVNVAYTGGAATRTVAVTWQEPVRTPYAVLANAPEACTAIATSKTALGFSLVITSVPSGNLTTGTVRCLIVG